MGTEHPGVRVEDLIHVYPTPTGPVLAIDRLSLKVDPGEFVCLLGPSGCGKSTLLRVVAGLLRPTSGSMERDYPFEPGPGQQDAVGWMAQRDGLLPWRTVLSNVMLPLQVQGEKAERARGRAQVALRLAGLERFGRHYPHQLSGGMRQRAALARAVAHEPGLLLLDEPFAHLDELTREELGDALVRLWAARRPTLLMVTHSALEAVRLADRVVVLSPRPARVIGEVRPAAPQPRSEDDPSTLEALREARALLRGTGSREGEMESQREGVGA